MQPGVNQPTRGYLSERAFSTEAGPFSHAGGGSALTKGQMRWVEQKLAQLPSNAGAYLQAQSAYAPADTYVTTTYAGRWYALYMTASGPIYLTYAIGDPLGAAPIAFHGGGPPQVMDPGQAVANFATALANYINAHGCDNSPTMVQLVQGYQGALNTFIAGLRIPNKPAPFVVDGVYSSDLQKYLAVFAKDRNIAFTPCSNLPPGQFVTPSPQPPTPTPPSKTGGTPPSTGLSTNAKIGIGVGVLAAGALAVWLYSESQKKKEHHR